MSGIQDNGTLIPEGFAPIDIKAPKFFRFVRRWKEGTLATIDGWGRFAEISFIGADKIKITPLVNFPRVAMDDRSLITWPEAGLIAITSGKIHHIAAIDAGKTKSHTPILTWVHQQFNPVLIDPDEGLVAYCYLTDRNDNDIDTSIYIYNPKEDAFVYDSPRISTMSLGLALNREYIFGSQYFVKGRNRGWKNALYQWRTNTVVENKLTDIMDKNGLDPQFTPYTRIDPVRRFLFGTNDIIRCAMKISWDENYSDIQAVPLSYLHPPGKYFIDVFALSADGKWATDLVSGYEGLYGERLRKRAFFHLDERYPNGISMPLITEDYEQDGPIIPVAFVNHPVHGLCFAQEWHKEEGGKDRLYLRLYRMDGVLAEINRRLLERVQ